MISRDHRCDEQPYPRGHEDDSLAKVVADRTTQQLGWWLDALLHQLARKLETLLLGGMPHPTESDDDQGCEAEKGKTDPAQSRAGVRVVAGDTMARVKTELAGEPIECEELDETLRVHVENVVHCVGHRRGTQIWNRMGLAHRHGEVDQNREQRNNRLGEPPGQ